MKKIIILIFIGSLVFSCSDIDNTIEEKESVEFMDDLAKDIFCGPAHHLEVTFADELLLFKAGGEKKGTCKRQSFGFCFAIDINISFDCVPNTANISTSLQKVSYNTTNKEITAVGISDPTSNEINFYFDKGIINSPDHQQSDFDTLDVGDGFYIAPKTKLVKGSYPKIIEGNFFKYVVSYIDEN